VKQSKRQRTSSGVYDSSEAGELVLNIYIYYLCVRVFSTKQIKIKGPPLLILWGITAKHISGAWVRYTHLGMWSFVCKNLLLQF
jgi:hypothetical protein